MRVTEHEVPEDNIIARFRAEDKDSGAFGQVMMISDSGLISRTVTSLSRKLRFRDYA